LTSQLILRARAINSQLIWYNLLQGQHFANSKTHAIHINQQVSMKTRILVIDDDPSITALLKRGLTYEGYIVDVASTGKGGLDIAREQPPNLVILDVMMPGLDGLEVCRRFRAADPNLPIIMLTAKDGVDDQVEGLENGADDYVVKPFTFEVLLARIRALLRRVEPVGAEKLRFADLVLDTGTHSASRGQREIELTTTEYQLLSEFLRHPRQVLAKEQLVDRVWGYDFDGNYNILEVYVRYLRSKLEAGGEARLIHTVRGAGYLLREPCDGEERE
jgi:DNA-binding response OmpR family regulator